MRLLSLTCEQESFHNIYFRRGISLIVGDNPENHQEGSSNGVGKTLALGLLHHCLGGNADPRLKQAAADWKFELRFEQKQEKHCYTRRGDGEDIRINGRAVKLHAWRTELNESGAFIIPEDVQYLTFRSLFVRFARYAREDCQNPIYLSSEQEHESILRGLFLLNIDPNFIYQKIKLKENFNKIQATQKNIKNDSYLQEILKKNKDASVRIRFVQEKILEMEKNLEKFKIAQDYSLLYQEAEQIKEDIQKINHQISLRQYTLESLKQSQNQSPDISKEELLEFYRGIHNIFKEDVIESFKNIEEFQKSLLKKRKERVQKEIIQVEKEIILFQKKLQEKINEQNEKMERLRGAKLQDEYMSVSRQLAVYKEEIQTLQKYKDIETKFKSDLLEIKKEINENNIKADQYIQSQPLQTLEEYFRKITQFIYPNYTSGLAFGLNGGENKLQYNFDVILQGDSSDGINAAKILCFDWLTLVHGSNHTMEFVWHDNRLFADLDPSQRAKWFSYVIKNSIATGKDYIASINYENLNSMRPYLDAYEWEQLERSIVLELRGDDPKNKLLGIQFEGS